MRLRTLLLAGLALSLLGGPVWAQTDTVRYVNGTTGGLGYNGRSATFVSGSIGPYKTIAQANAYATTVSTSTGYRVYVAPGTYAHSPDPARSGSAAHRITYIGSPDSSVHQPIWNWHPKVVVTDPAGLELADTCVTVRGFEFMAGNAGFESGPVHGAAKDSITRCHFHPTLSVGPQGSETTRALAFSPGASNFKSARECVFYDNHGRWNQVWAGCGNDQTGACPCTSGRTANITLRLNTIDLIAEDLSVANSKPCWLLRSPTFWTIDSNRVTLTLPPNTVNGDDQAFLKFFNMTRSVVADNSFALSDPTLLRIGSDLGYWMQRDSTSLNVFTRDTIENIGPGGVWFMPTNSGSCSGANTANTYDHFVFKNPYRGTFGYYDAVNGDVWTHCLMLNRDGVALVNSENLNGLTIDHCTVVDSTPNGPALLIHPDDTSTGYPGAFRLTNSLIYNKHFGAPDRTRGGSALAYYNRYADAILNRNFYWHPNPQIANGAGTTHRAGIRSAKFWNVKRDGEINGGSTAFAYSRADSTPWRSNRDSSFNTSLGVAPSTSWIETVGDSLTGPASFVDSALISFNPALAAGSGALGRATGGANCGAWQTPGDTTKPGPAINLHVAYVTRTVALVGFIAPGDDGSAGRCVRYELAYSTSPITTDALYDAALKFPNSVTPNPAGWSDGIVVTGISPETTYYFSVKAFDDAGNRGPLPTAASGTTPGAPPTGGGGGKGVISADD